jgi:hypothetical protein
MADHQQLAAIDNLVAQDPNISLKDIKKKLREDYGISPFSNTRIKKHTKRKVRTQANVAIFSLFQDIRLAARSRH